jgi:HCOMODA/2-hydroxy-3-carboxy-muconic semialdehyde decarboxylase
MLDDLVAANRVLVDQGVMQAYGHVSARDPRNPERYWLSRSSPPAMVTHNHILEFDLDSRPVRANAPKLYEERAIHGEIYRARPDVMCVIHNHCESLIPFCNTDVKLRPMVGNAWFLREGPPVFDIRDIDDTGDMNICTREQGVGLARALGDHAVCLLRRHGAVIVGASVSEAVRRSISCDTNARLQLQSMPLGPVSFLTDVEIAYRVDGGSRDSERGWEMWKKTALEKVRAVK